MLFKHPTLNGDAGLYYIRSRVELFRVQVISNSACMDFGDFIFISAIYLLLPLFNKNRYTKPLKLTSKNYEITGKAKKEGTNN